MNAVAFAIAVAAFGLAACSKSKAPTEAEIPPAQTPAQKTVYDTQFKALQRAKDVQKVVDQQKQDMDKQLKDGGE